MKKYKYLGVLLVFLSMAFVGCGSQTGEEDVLNNRPLKIGVLFIEDNLPLFLAEAEKRFEKEGLQVELIPFPSAAERDAALQAGKLDGEAADVLATCLLKKGGTDVRIAFVTLGVTPKEGRFVLLGSPDSDIKSPKELAGVSIAVSENTIIEYVADRLLLAEGLNKEDIKKINVPKIPIRLQMLLNNQVKAALLPDPLASLAEKQGAKVILDDTESETNLSQVVFIFRKEAIDTNREAIEKFIKVYGKAAEDLNENPSKYRPLLIEKAKIPEPIRDSYKAPTFSEPQCPREEDVQNVINWMVDKKLIDEPYSYQEIVDESLIK